ncbi:MAG: acyl-CoA dehydrogenase family protein [Planctomycetota bacterium]
MNFELSQKHLQLQDMAREFADKILMPSADRYDRNEEFPAEQIEKLAGLGFLGILVSEQMGGLGLDTVGLTCALEEIHRGCASTGVTVSVHNSLLTHPLITFGNPAQCARYLPRLASGKSLGAYAITEPNHGSDAAAIETTCRRAGNKYILNGTKAWITNGSKADVVITFATLDAAKGPKGICAFIVEREFSGFQVGKKELKLGIRGSDTVQLVFEDLEVPVENLLGEEGQGFKIAMHTLDGGRIGIATQAVGIAQACLEASLRYLERNESLQHSQALQHKLADMAMEIDAARLLTYRAASLKDRGRPHSVEASKAKLYASETSNRAAREAVQIHGGEGICRGASVDRLFRDARITEIYEGTSEIQRLVIARQTLKNARPA